MVRGGPVAQRLEQQTHNLLVVGSNPTGPTTQSFIFPSMKIVDGYGVLFICRHHAA